MPAFYRDGVQYNVDPTRSEARFCLNGIGLPVIRGTLPVRAGKLIIRRRRRNPDGELRARCHRAGFRADSPRR